MKTLRLILASAFVAMSLTVMATPITGAKTFTLVRTPTTFQPEEEDLGERKPGRPFSCTFDTETGIEFIGQETPEFALFEIYVTDTECIYASGDEFDFINHLFTLSGSYQICLTTTYGCVYSGYVNL